MAFWVTNLYIQQSNTFYPAVEMIGLSWVFSCVVGVDVYLRVEMRVCDFGDLLSSL